MARISRSKSADEDVTDEERSDASAAFASVGISLYNQKGEYQDLSDTLDELASKWNDLSDAQQNYIAEKAAGTRGINVFKAMMDTYKDAKALAEDALASPDFIDETQEKYEESLVAAQEKLSAAMEGFWNNIMGSQVLTSFIDFGAQIVNIFANISGSVRSVTDDLGGVGSALGQITTTAAIAGSALMGIQFVDLLRQGKSLKDSALGAIAPLTWTSAKIGGLFSIPQLFAEGWKTSATTALDDGTVIQNSNYTRLLGGLSKALPGISSGLKGLKDGLKGTSLTGVEGISGSEKLFNKLGFFVNQHPIVTALTAAIGVALAGKAYVDSRETEAKTSASESYDEYVNTNKELSSKKDNIESLVSTYEDLYTGVDTRTNKNVSLSKDELSEYKDTINSLAEIAPELVKGYDSAGNAILDSSKVLKSATTEVEKDLYENAKTNWDENLGKYIEAGWYEIGGSGSLTFEETKDTARWMLETNKIYEVVKNMSFEDMKADLAKGNESAIRQTSEIWADAIETRYVRTGDKDAWNEWSSNVVSKLSLDTTASEIRSALISRLDIAEYDKEYNFNEDQWNNLRSAMSFVSDKDLVNFVTGSQDPEEYVNRWMEVLSTGGTKIQSALENILNLDNDFTSGQIDRVSASIDALAASLGDVTSRDALKDMLVIDQDIDELISGYNKAQETLDSFVSQSKTERTASDKELQAAGYAKGTQSLQQWTTDKENTKYQSAIVNAVRSDGTVMTKDEMKTYLDDYFQTGYDPFDLVVFADKSVKKVSKEFKNIEKSLKKSKKDARELADELDINTSDDLALLDNMIQKYEGDLQALKENWNIDSFSFEKANAELEALEDNISKVTSHYEKVADAISGSTSANGMTRTQIEDINSLFASQKGYNYDKLFESTALGVSMNFTELRKLNSEWKKTETEKYSKEISKLEENYANYAKTLAQCTKGTDEYNEAQKNLISTKELIQKAQEIQSLYEGQTNAVYEWQQALNGGERGDLYDTIADSGISSFQKRWEQGEIGTNEYRSFIQMFTGDDVSALASQKLVSYGQEALDKANRYLTENRYEGMYNVLSDLQDFNKELAYMDSSGLWHVNADSKQIAKALDVSESMATVFMQKLNDMGFDMTFAEDNKYLKELRSDASGAFTSLDEGTKEKYKINMDATDLEDVEGQIKNIQKAMEESVDEQEKGYLQEILDYYLARKGEILADFNIDIGMDDVESLSSLVNSLEENYDISITIDWGNEDPSYYSRKIEELKEDLKEKLNLGSNEKISLDTEGYQDYLQTYDAMQKKQILSQIQLDNIGKTGTEQNVLYWDTTGMSEGYQQAVSDAQNLEMALISLKAMSESSNLFELDNDYKVSKYMDLIDAFGNLQDNSAIALKLGYDNAGLDFEEIINNIDGLPDEIKMEILALYGGDSEEVLNSLSEEDKVVNMEVMVDDSNVKEYQPEAKEGVVEESVDDSKWQELKLPKKEAFIESVLNKDSLDSLDEWLEEHNNIVLDVVTGTQPFEYLNVEDKNAVINYTQQVSGSFDELSDLNKEAVIRYSIDTGELENFSVEDQYAMVTYMIEHGMIDDYITSDKDSEATVTFKRNSSDVDSYSPKNLSAWVTYLCNRSNVDNQNFNKTATVTYFKKNGSQNLEYYDGTAHAGGTANAEGTVKKSLWQRAKDKGRAFIKGDWGVKRAGTSLINEVGPEIIVRGHQWFVANQGRAGFTDLKRDDIVFNAKQSEEILKNGYVTSGGGHGSIIGVGSHLQGSAHASGTWSGGGYLYNSGNVYTGSSTSSNNSSSNKSSSNSASDAADEFSEKLDEIEILIDRLERKIDDFDSKASSIFRSWANRMTDLGSQMSLISQEITKQAEGYTRYLKEANSIGLDETWAKKVRDGLIDIEEVTDEDTWDKIEQYQEWYDKALDCLYAQTELQESLSELQKTKFDNIVTQFTELQDQIEHTVNLIENELDIVENKGKFAGAGYYISAMEEENKRLASLNEEYNTLMTEQQAAVDSGNISKFSEAWYEMQSEINDVAEAYSECTNRLIELKNEMREMDWSAFEWGMERVENLNREIDFLQDLMGYFTNNMFDKETGRFTKQGLANAALMATQYDVYMAQAETYANKIKELNKMLAEDPYNTILLDKKAEYIQLQQDSIESANQEKLAVRDLYEEMYNRILDIMQDLIDKRKEWLEGQHDIYEYSNTVSEQVKSITDLRKQLMALENDQSEETLARIQAKREELSKAEKELEKTEYQQYLEDQEAMLDKIYQEADRVFNQRLDNIDGLLQEIVDYGNTNAVEVKDTINSAASEAGYTICQGVEKVWTGANSVLSNYHTNTLSGFYTGVLNSGTTVSSYLKDIFDLIKSEFTKGETKTTATVSTPAKTTSTTTNTVVTKPTTTTTKPSTTNDSPAASTTSTKKTISAGTKVNAGSAPIYWDSTGRVGPYGSHQYFSSDPVYYVTKVVGNYAAARHHTQSTVAGWFKLSDLTAMATGGYTGNYEGAAYLHKKERVLSAQQTKAFDALVYEYLPAMVDQIKTAQLKDLGLYNADTSYSGGNYNTPSSEIKDVNISFNLPNVTDSASFMKEIQNNRDFRQLVTSLVLDPAVGKGKLRKNTIKMY